MLPFTLRRTERISWLKGKLLSVPLVQSSSSNQGGLVDGEDLVLVAERMPGEPLWLPFLQTQEPLCHSAPASDAQTVSESQRHTDPNAEFLTFSVSACLDMAAVLCCSVRDSFDSCNGK